MDRNIERAVLRVLRTMSATCKSVLFIEVVVPVLMRYKVVDEFLERQKTRTSVIKWRRGAVGYSTRAASSF
jgi:hypothetical protein